MIKDRPISVDGLIRKIAAAPLWPDQHPEAHDHDLVSIILTKRDVRFARAVLRARRAAARPNRRQVRQ